MKFVLASTKWYALWSARLCQSGRLPTLIVSGVQLKRTDNSLSAATLLSEWDSVWAFRDGRGGATAALQRKAGRADEVVVYHQDQCRPIFEVHV